MVAQLYIDPKKCINCGSCIAVCECEAIFEVDELPGEMQQFVTVNATYYKK
jgi:ferredoxin--NADP+ reductase